ncbi:MAG: hypothetical protein PHF50_00660 [Patescibacteria group bacterium]|nr:hypothetical protein [Patescibacteria group bacterium]
MKCGKHPDVKMVVKEMAVGWGNESKLVCPKCEEEAKASADKTIGSQAVFSVGGHGGW